jgi:hypothetical protein
MHCCGLMQVEQGPPSVPHAVESDCPSAHVPSVSQQPPLQWPVVLQKPEQEPAEHVWYRGQSGSLLHPQSPAVQTPDMQIAGSVPHEVYAGQPDSSHIPLIQHPPLHRWLTKSQPVAEQRKPEHVWPIGHCVGSEQLPHAMPCWQVRLPTSDVQSVQRPPSSPQAVSTLPVRHVVPSQQPPLHASPPWHDWPQVFVTGLHA